MSLFTKENVNNYFSVVIDIVKDRNSEKVEETIILLKKIYNSIFEDEMKVETDSKDIKIQNPIELVTFDVDGTLWDTNIVLRHVQLTMFDYLIKLYPKVRNCCSTSEIFEKKVIELRKTDPQKLMQFAILRREFLKFALKEAGYSSEITEDVINNIMNVYITARHQIEQYNPMVIETLTILNNMKIKTGVITNGTTDITRIPELNKLMMFDVKGQEVNSCKPDTKMFELAMKKGDVNNPKLAIHIGDCYEEDILGAMRSGFHSIWISNFELTPSIDEGTIDIPSFQYVLPSILHIMLNSVIYSHLFAVKIQNTH